MITGTLKAMTPSPSAPSYRALNLLEQHSQTSTAATGPTPRSITQLFVSDEVEDERCEKPTVEAALEHAELCRVRNVQEKLRDLWMDAQTSGHGVSKEFTAGQVSLVELLQKSELFPLDCDTSDLGSLGLAYPAYFFFLRCLIVLLLLQTLILVPVLWQNLQAYQGVANQLRLRSWNKLALATENDQFCKSCTGSNLGRNGAEKGPSNNSAYGTRCFPWDLTHCDGFKDRLNDDECGVGRWCCESWCYVDRRCPYAKGSTLMEGLYWAYLTCDSDPQTLKNCPWQSDCTFHGKPINDDREYRMIYPWFLSAGNWGMDAETGYGNCNSIVPTIWYVLASVAVLIGIPVSRHLLFRIEHDADLKITHPNDFAIMASGLPADATSSSEIQKFFEEHALGGSDDEESDGSSSEKLCGTIRPEILKVIICWDLRELAQLKQEHAALDKKKADADADELEESEIQEINDRLDELEQKMNACTDASSGEPLSCSGTAFVIFRSRAALRLCLKKWNTSWFEWCYQYMKCPGKCWPVLPRFRDMHDLKVARAPNPSDIQWEMIDYPRWKRCARRLLTLLIMAAICAAAVYFCYELKMIQEKLLKESTDAKTGRLILTGNLVLAPLPALAVSALNCILSVLSPALASLEMHRTVTSEIANGMLKIALCYFIIAGVDTFAVNYARSAWSFMFEGTPHIDLWTSWGFLFDGSPKMWYKQQGLVSDIIFVLIFAGIFTLVFALVDFMWLIRRARACMINLDTTDMSQAEYNTLYEPSEADLQTWHACAILIFLLAVLYSPLLPVAPFLGALLLALMYGGTKYAVLRLAKQPQTLLGSSLAAEGLHFLRVCISILLPLSIAIFQHPSTGEEARPTLEYSTEVLFLVSVCSLLLPNHALSLAYCWEESYQPSDSKEEDYYASQYLWPREWKYHKSHILYKELPEDLNPEHLVPDQKFTTAPELNPEDLLRSYWNALPSDSQGLPVTSTYKQALQQGALQLVLRSRDSTF